MGDTAVKFSTENLLTFILGPDLIKLRLTKAHREFEDKKHLMRSYFKHEIQRVRQEWVKQR